MLQDMKKEGQEEDETVGDEGEGSARDAKKEMGRREGTQERGRGRLRD